MHGRGVIQVCTKGGELCPCPRDILLSGHVTAEGRFRTVFSAHNDPGNAAVLERDVFHNTNSSVRQTFGSVLVLCESDWGADANVRHVVLSEGVNPHPLWNRQIFQANDAALIVETSDSYAWFNTVGLVGLVLRLELRGVVSCCVFLV